MSEQNHRELRSPNDWLISQLQFSVALIDLRPSFINTVWSNVFEAEPLDQISSRRNGIEAVFGQFDDFFAQIQVSTSEKLASLILLDAGQDFANTGYDGPISTFKLLFPKLLSQIGDSNASKLVYKADAFLKVGSKEEAYVEIIRYLPFDIDLTNCSELSFHLTRHMNSKCDPTVKIERSCRWSVGLLNRQKIGDVSPPTTMNCCRAEIEIEAEVAKDNIGLNSLVEEMITLGYDYIARGDVK